MPANNLVKHLGTKILIYTKTTPENIDQQTQISQLNFKNILKYYEKDNTRTNIL